MSPGPLIADHPYLAAGLALVAGLILGWLANSLRQMVRDPFDVVSGAEIDDPDNAGA